MKTINAQTIINAVMQAIAAAPESSPDVEVCKTAPYQHLVKQLNGLSSKDTAQRMAVQEKMDVMEIKAGSTGFVTFKTGDISHHTIRNIRSNLEKFAASVKANARLFGGGLDKPVKKPAPAVTWSAGKVKLLSEMFEDKQFADALAMGESELGAVFYSVEANIYDKGNRVFMTWAPMAVDGLPDCMASVKQSDGYFRVIHVPSGRGLGNGAKSRNACIKSAFEAWGKIPDERKDYALSSAKINNCELSRAAWIEYHQINDDRAIQARIAEQARIDADQQARREARQVEKAKTFKEVASDAMADIEAKTARYMPAAQESKTMTLSEYANSTENMGITARIEYKKKLEREALAAQDVAQVVAHAVANIAITEAMADSAEPELCEAVAELVTCEAGESEASAPTAGQASWSPVPQYVPPSLSQVKPGEPVPPAFRGGLDDIDPPSGGNAEATPHPMESTDFSGDIPLSLAVSAFGGVSMSPERRGQSAKNEYAQSMAEDLETLRTQATKGGTLDLLPEVFARYRSRQASSYKAYLSSSSRCVSSFIAGPSNFPAARMNKRADISHRRLTEYLDGGKMALQAAIRTLRPDLRAIMAGDADAIDRLTVKIESAERAQASMKAANKAIRANAKQGEAHQVAALMELGFSERQAIEVIKPDFCGRIGFASYSLTNNNANIRRMKERLEQISKAQATEVHAVECANGVTLEDDAPANRVRLYFPGKPSEAIRDELKSSGFRWAPSVGAWQAYRNYGTLATARRMAGEPLPAAPEVAEVEQVEQVEATPPVAVSTEAPTPARWNF